jgi:hypothetical protein
MFKQHLYREVKYAFYVEHTLSINLKDLEINTQRGFSFSCFISRIENCWTDFDKILYKRFLHKSVENYRRPSVCL